MKKLANILLNINCELTGSDSIPVDSIIFDSRLAKANTLFAALKGSTHDGHDFIVDVVKQGCKCILCEQLPVSLPKDIAFSIILKVSTSPSKDK